MTHGPLDSLTRTREMAGDRAQLDEILDEVKVGTLTTVVDGLPWSVPMLVARDGDRILVHGSTGAGALRHVAAGAPVALTAFVLDAIVIADSLFEHSANYRSAVVRGTLEDVAGDSAHALDVLSEKLIPGRPAEVRGHTDHEVSATTILAMDIVDGQWIVKVNDEPPIEPEEPQWTGIVPARMVYDAPIAAGGGEVPESVRRLIGPPR